MVTRVTLSAILLVGLLATACTGDFGSKTTAAIQRPSTSPGIVSTRPTPAAQLAGPPGVLTATPAAQIPARIPQPPQAMPPSPPRPVIPLPGHPAIAVCGPIPAVPTIRSVLPAVCGGGFHPAEVVTLTLIGRLGRLTWLAVVGPDGSFRSAIPSGYCRLLALSVTARGSRGSIASAPATALAYCRML